MAERAAGNRGDCHWRRGDCSALAAFKVIDLSRLWGTKLDHPAGYVGIPLSARSIPAYTEVTRDYLLNPKTGKLVVKWVAAERRSEGDHYRFVEDSQAGDGTRQAGCLLFPRKRLSARGHSPRAGGRHASGQAGDYLGRDQTQGCA